MAIAFSALALRGIDAQRLVIIGARIIGLSRLGIDVAQRHIRTGPRRVGDDGRLGKPDREFGIALADGVMRLGQQTLHRHRRRFGGGLGVLGAGGLTRGGQRNRGNEQNGQGGNRAGGHARTISHFGRA